MKHFLVLSALFCMNQAFGQTCEPDYQVVRKACKNTDQVLRYEIVVKEKVRVNTGACNPDAAQERQLCNDHSKQEIVSSYPGARHQDVRIKRSYSEVAKGKFCEGAKNRRDVYCDFEFPAPVYVKVRDASCPVEGVIEAQDCFKPGDLANVSMKSVNDCLDLVPQNDETWSVKIACLNDLYQAESNLRLKTPISTETYDKIARQLHLSKKKAQELKLIDLKQQK